MDETVKPLRIPPQISVYADKHNILHLVQSMLSSLVIDQPEDPITYLISLLQRSTFDIPRVVLLGPPAVGKHTVAKKLSSELRAVHVTLQSLLSDQSELSAQTQNTEQELPAELLVRLIQQRLNQIDCFNRGWVLEGIPQSRLQALSLQQAGVIPEHVVMLEAPDDVLLERTRGKLVDPLTGDVYHQNFIWPDDDAVAERLETDQSRTERQRLADLQRYRREVTGLSSAYQHILKVINSDQPHTDVYQQVCCGQLLRSVAADGSDLGQEIQPYLDDGRPVPDSLVLKVLDERLSRVDCSCRGWILHGFPRDLQQAKSLQQTQIQPNRVFLLELTDDVCVERISLRATDPVSGERFHLVTRPAPSSEVQNRLKTRPEDSAHTLTHTLSQYRTHTAALQSVYPDAVHIDADQDPRSVFETLESLLTAH
ncbi:adenylate kinase 8 isoform 3-T4 [Acanthopagrus schlegelii]